MSLNRDPALHVVVPCALVAAAEAAARRGTRLPALESLLAGARLERIDETLEHVAGRLLGIEGLPPLAALRLAATDATAAHDGFWVCADPVRVQLSVDNVHITGPCDDLAPDEATSVVAALNEHLAGDDLRFIMADARHWYARCDHDALLSTTPLWRAIGPPVRGLLPAGADGARWRTLMNETQMVLHAHPVNVAREEAGRPRIGSLWWWGEGSWPRFSTPAVDIVAGGPAWLSAARAASGIDRATDDIAGVIGAAAGGKRAMWVATGEWEVAATADHLARLTDWDLLLQPLADALTARRLTAVALLFDDDGATLRATCAPAPGSLRGLLRRWAGGHAPASAPLAETLARMQR